MSTAAYKKKDRLQKLDPKAWIGYLVGYQSSNIYRVWVPSINKVIRTRDVIFNEDQLFSGDINEFKDDLLYISPKKLEEFLKESALPDLEELPESSPPVAEDENEFEEPLDDIDFIIESDINPDAMDDAGVRVIDDDAADPEAMEVVESPEDVESPGDAEGPYICAGFEPFPTPSPSPPAAALIAHAIRSIGPEAPSQSMERVKPTNAWQAAFVAGTLAGRVGKANNEAIDKAKLQRLLRLGRAIHRSDLPAPPIHHRDLNTHIMGELFRQAEETHLKSHRELRSWTEISRRDPRVKGNQVLDCMWVYVYKFKKNGHLLKCKARLVVRGDQQKRSRTEETYAATLAGRSFRTLMAIAARFDLELIQYDVVNAFVNARLTEDVFMRMPPGYRKPGTILKLDRALYGLRISPLLWQRELTRTLHELGFESVPHEPCCFSKDGILLFFYVDDIVLACSKSQRAEARELLKGLKERYYLTGGNNL
jgi:gamma-glutamylcyclotransferase (GGCT)/AIG2-like uncharacterized protein YtfP